MKLIDWKKHAENPNTWMTLLAVLFALISAMTLVIIGPQNLVDMIGENNVYLAVYALGAGGIVSTLTGGIFYSSLVAFASSNVSLPLLALAAGLGLSTSDNIFFYLATRGRQVLQDYQFRWLERFESWVQGLPRWGVAAVVIGYFGFTPFPNDILMTALAAGGYKVRFISPLIVVGNMTGAFIFVYFGSFLFG